MLYRDDVLVEVELEPPPLVPDAVPFLFFLFFLDLPLDMQKF
jgi:hypothetical protein